MGVKELSTDYDVEEGDCEARVYEAQNEAFEVEVGGFERKYLSLRGLRGWAVEEQKKRSVYIALISV